MAVNLGARPNTSPTSASIPSTASTTTTIASASASASVSVSVSVPVSVSSSVSVSTTATTTATKPRPTFASTSEAISTLPSQGDFRSKEYRHLHYPGCNINRRGSATLSPAPSISHSSTGSSSYSTTKRSKMSILQHPQPSASKSAQQQFENKNKQIGSNGSVVAQHYVCDVAKIPIVTPRPSSTALPVTTNGKQIGSPKLPPVITQDMRNRTNLPDELPIVKCIARARIPTTQGPDIFLHLYENNVDNKEHLAIVFGENIRSRSLFKQRPGETQQDRMTRGAYIGKLSPGRTLADTDGENTLEFNSDGDLIVNNLTFQEPTLVRIHSECYTGETAWSARCDCGEQFDQAGKIMGENGHGCMVYLRQEGRGIGLGEKLKAYNLQDLGADTVEANLLLRHPADARNFSLATAILLDLGLVEIKLLTNNPDKIIAVEGKHREVKVKERIPMIPLSWSYTNDESESNGSVVKAKGIKSKEIDGYLSTKIERMGHLLEKPIKINSQ